MVIDTKEHQEMLLDLINSATIPGSVAEKVAELLKAIKEAEIKDV